MQITWIILIFENSPNSLELISHIHSFQEHIRPFILIIFQKNEVEIRISKKLNHCNSQEYLCNDEHIQNTWEYMPNRIVVNKKIFILIRQEQLYYKFHNIHQIISVVPWNKRKWAFSICKSSPQRRRLLWRRWTRQSCSYL